jgi:hypothetical protein
LVLVAEALLVKETLRYDDVEKLVGKRPFPHKHPYSEFEGALDDGSSGDDVGASETAAPPFGTPTGGVAPVAAAPYANVVKNV